MRKGFSLIQVSILLTVASLVMVAALPSVQSSVNATALTTKKLNVVLSALRQYQVSQGTLPCPADATQPIGSATYGVMAANNGIANDCYGGSPSANYKDSTNHIAIGMVPVRALALSNDYALDSYGRTITYAVDTNATESCWSSASLAGAISVTDNGAAMPTVAVLVSHGADGHGAWIPRTGASGSAVRLNTGSTDTDQLTNAHVNSSFTPTSLFSSFVRKPPTSTFDDLLAYKSSQWGLAAQPSNSIAIAPTVTAPSDGTYMTGNALSFTLTYNTTVTVTGTPRLALSAIGTGNNIGTSNVAYANYISGSGTNALTFSYTVTATDGAMNGITLTSPINLNGGTVDNCQSFSPPDLSGVLIGYYMWVVDQANNRVEKFNSVGTYLLSIGAGYQGVAGAKNSAGSANGQFSNPWGIAADASGNVWVVDQQNHRLQEFNSSGVWIRSVGGPSPYTCETTPAGTVPACAYGAGNGQLRSPQGITIDSGGNIWVAEMGNNRVQEFDSNGNYVSKFGTAGTGDGQISAAATVTFDHSGYIWVSEWTGNRVQKFTTAGVFQAGIGAGYQGVTGAKASAGSANGQFDAAIGVAVDASGNLWFGDFWNNRVQKFNSAYAFVKSIGGPAPHTCTTSPAGSRPSCAASPENGAFMNSQSVRIDPLGNLWVMDFFNQRLQMFDTSGNWIRSFGGYPTYACETAPAGATPACAVGTADGQFQNPTDVAFFR